MEEARSENVIWDLKDLYSGPHDPDIEKDKQWCREQAKLFARAYRQRVCELEPEQLLEAVRHYEYLLERARKLLSFAQLFFATQTQDSAASALWQSIQEFHGNLRRDILFFELEWARLEESKALRLSSHPSLEGYRHYLEILKRYGPHQLSEAEEKILAEKETTGIQAWCTLFDKVLTHIRFGGGGRTESEVLADLYGSDRGTRKAAAVELTEGLQDNLHILSHIFNTLLLDKAITDRLRSYPHWLSERNLSNEASDRMVEALVQSVSSRYDMVSRYYRIKRRLLGVDVLYDYDRYAPLPGACDRVFEWEEAREIVLAAFKGFSSELSEIARLFFDKGWIHAPVMRGKRSGAFAHSTIPSAHPYVLLNYSGRIKDVMTLAHELGHGVHQYLAAKQGLFNAETPLTTAETASIFGEMLVFRHLLRLLDSPMERLALLCGRLEDAFATVFRQVAMNRFENLAHNERREKGELNSEHISRLWLETQSAMFGDSVQLLDHYGIWWSYIPHLVHWPGYVYAYAFGNLLVLALYQDYVERGADFVPLYIDLLEAGGRNSPEDLLKPFKIDLEDPEFWQRGLAAIEALLEEAERESANIFGLEA
jgi:oligoendopeptidase F